LIARFLHGTRNISVCALNRMTGHDQESCGGLDPKEETNPVFIVFFFK